MAEIKNPISVEYEEVGGDTGLTGMYSSIAAVIDELNRRYNAYLHLVEALKPFAETYKKYEQYVEYRITNDSDPFGIEDYIYRFIKHGATEAWYERALEAIRQATGGEEWTHGPS
jgi:hypothetical protein